MKWAPSFWRKVIYITIMVALVFPLAYLGMPAMNLGETSTPGGVIAQKRNEYRLDQAQLGEIDPATETMRLAALGMNGVASAVLWDAANEYKKKSDWDNLMATLKQLSKFQPNFSTVWEHQSWNVAYNVSVEFDDYKQRYHWVKKGIDYLIQGTHYNKNDTRLLSYNGWMIGHKMGRSDEHVQFRKLFGKDKEFHKILKDEGARIENAQGPYGFPDNWLVAKEWYLKAEAVHTAGNPIKGESPLLFFSHRPMQMMDYAQSMEEEGILDERARIAWEQAGDAWQEFGGVSIETTWGVPIRLSELDRGEKDGIEGQIKALRAELDALSGPIREEMLAEKRKTLTPDEQQAWDTKPADRKSEQITFAASAEQKLTLNHEEVAQRVPADKRTQARILAAHLKALEEKSSYIRSYRQIVNFNYWRTRAEVEQTETATNARKFARDADNYFKKHADLESALEAYEKSWNYWAEIYSKHPELVEDATADDVFDQVKNYRQVLDHKSLPFPADFKLKKLLDYKKPNWQTTLLIKPDKGGAKKPEPPMPPDETPEGTKPTEKKTTEKKTTEKTPEVKKPELKKPEPPMPPDEAPDAPKPAEKKGESASTEKR